MKFRDMTREQQRLNLIKRYTDYREELLQIVRDIKYWNAHNKHGGYIDPQEAWTTSEVDQANARIRDLEAES